MLTSEEPNVEFEAHHSIENHIVNKDHEGLMRVRYFISPPFLQVEFFLIKLCTVFHQDY
jgi:hypothetical protein